MIHFCADVRMINNSGIGVYISNYIRFILSEKNIQVTLIGKKADLITHFGDHSNWNHIEATFPIYSILEQIKLPYLIPFCDVFWSPHYNVPMLPIKARRRLSTIPDVYHLAYLHTLSLAQKIYARIVINTSVRISDKIITISQFSKDEIHRLTFIACSKIEVIHLGIDNDLFRFTSEEKETSRIKLQYKLPDKYILFVGNVKPNKNLRRLVEGLSKVLAEYPELFLVIVGKKSGFITGDLDLFTFIENDEHLKAHIVFTEFVQTTDLPYIYNLASVFAFPSIYEGFGFPPLEAMACGCPVVASNASSIPEICGDAAYYINPNDSDSISTGLINVLKNGTLREQLISAGFVKCSQYSWKQSSSRFENIIINLATD